MSRYRWSMRTLLAVVLLCAAMFGGLRWHIDSYRQDWLIEQQALAEMRRAGANVGAATRPIGPLWLRRLAGPDRVRYFDRTRILFFTASDHRIAERYRKSFKYCHGAALQD